MEHIEVDIVHDVVKLRNVIGGGIFLEITSYFHPAFEAEKVGFTVTSHFLFDEGSADRDYGTVFLRFYLVILVFLEALLEH